MAYQRTLVNICLMSFAFASALFSAGRGEPDFHSLYEGRHWFALRDAVAKRDAGAFYRGAVESAFQQTKQAEADLTAVIRSAPHGGDANEAHSLLAGQYLRNGQYRAALEQVEVILRERPGSEDARGTQPLLKVLAQSPDQALVQKEASTVSMQDIDGNLFVPAKIEGRDANYAFDSGANFSLVSESEAARVGLVAQDVNSKMGTTSGAEAGFRVAVAKSLQLGGIRLANVAFLVFPDKQPPFNELPEGKRGIIGIPVLLALETIRWSPGGAFEAGGASQGGIADANLCFDGANPVVQVGFQNSVLDFTLDTGAQNTELHKAFAEGFPELMKSGKNESHVITGVGGSTRFDSITLASLSFRVGGRDVALHPAHVIRQKSSYTSAYFAGNLGMDLLNQARRITIDFQKMTLALE
jgi:predicted aspartyl protease